MYTHSLVITINYKNSQSIFSPILLPWLPRTRPTIIIALSDLIRFCTTYIVSRWTHREHIRCPATNHTENTASSVVFTAPLHRNLSYPIVACVFIVAGMCSPSRCLEMCLTYPTATSLRLLVPSSLAVCHSSFLSVVSVCDVSPSCKLLSLFCGDFSPTAIDLLAKFRAF
jgi:hypothetical protein